MKKYIILGIIILAVILGGGVFALFSALSGGPWEGVWWGVQEAGMNWSGDNIRNLETITFTRNDDKTITVDHRVQQVFGNGIRCKRRREQDTVINPVAGFFPVSIVHLSGIYKDHLPRQQPALFAIDAVPHGSVFDVDELKFGMPVIDNGE